jgi:hypothetical protein
MKIKNKKKLVEDLVNTFNDRDELHIAYKKKVKHILFDSITSFLKDFEDYPHDDIMVSDLNEWISIYVETRFKPQG